MKDITYLTNLWLQPAIPQPPFFQKIIMKEAFSFLYTVKLMFVGQKI